MLAGDVVAPVDVPSFDRSNVDGFAVCGEDTFGASDERPISLRLTGETLVPGKPASESVTAGTATPISTGSVVPRGADSVVMVEYTDVAGGKLIVRRPVAPGAYIWSV